MEEKRSPHIIVVPHTLQGHVAPMMKLSELIASFGIKVTMVLTEHNYKRLTGSQDHHTSSSSSQGLSPVRLVAVSDGLELEDDRKDEAKVIASVFKVLPGHLINLVDKARGNDRDKIVCLIVDVIFGWAVEMAEKLDIKLAMFWTSSPGALVASLRIPELIEKGIIDHEGTPLKEKEIQLLPNMPSMSVKELPWYYPHKPGLQKPIFMFFHAIEQVIRRPRWLLCNWFLELNPTTRIALPNVVPIGPLLANGHPSGTLKHEDSTCLTWLDQQPLRSVIYVAYGSISTLTNDQLNELALGLEISKHRFLWVVRAGLTGNSPIKFPNGFEERVASYGKIVEWAPQEKVLAHSSISCFLTHCGWNSTMEGISNGVPFLCLTYFADQIYNRTCICHGWKIGVNLVLNESDGIVTRHVIKAKIDELLSNDGLISNSTKLKELARSSVGKGGSSFVAIQSFLEQIRC